MTDIETTEQEQEEKVQETNEYNVGKAAETPDTSAERGEEQLPREISEKDIPSDFTNGALTKSKADVSKMTEEKDTTGLMERIIAMSKSNNVLVVATDDESEPVSSCALPAGAFTDSTAKACRKFAELRRALEKAEEHSHASVSIIRYDPSDDSSGVYYSTRTRMPGGWRAPLRFKVRRHLVDAVAATNLWRFLDLMEYKKNLL